MVKSIARQILTAEFRRYLRTRPLGRFRRKAWNLKPGTVTDFLDYRVRVTDGPNFYLQYKDEFSERIYHFEAQRPDPLIIDGGSNIGMSILSFKRTYPQGRI